MPSRLKRFHASGQTHFLTFSCYQRRPFLNTDESRRIFESALERVRLRFYLCVYGYVVMPEHVHLLISEPSNGTDGADGAPFKPSFGFSGEKAPRCLADAIKSLKQGVSRRLIGEADHFWQKRYYDVNVRDHPQFMEKLRYIYRNPVKRGLCEQPGEWNSSSFLHYATASKDEWRSNRSGLPENANEQRGKSFQPQTFFPTQAKSRLEWGTRLSSTKRIQLRALSSA